MTDLKAALIQFEKTAVVPFGDDRHILRTEFDGNCFIYQSFGYLNSYFGDPMVTANVSFLADSGRGVAAEWEPCHGPIQVWTECDENYEEEHEFWGTIKARSHWHFPFVRDYSGNWSQLAVDNEGLKQHLIAGRVETVFRVLKRWAEC